MVGSQEAGLPPFQTGFSSFLFFIMAFSFFTYLFILFRSFSPKFSFLLPLPPPLEASCSYIRPESNCTNWIIVPAHLESLNAEDEQLRMKNLHAENWRLWRKSLEAEVGEVWNSPNAFHVQSLITWAHNHFWERHLQLLGEPRAEEQNQIIHRLSVLRSLNLDPNQS